jgi:hypothetical protein
MVVHPRPTKESAMSRRKTLVILNGKPFRVQPKGTGGMVLITPEIRERLIANWKAGPDMDHVPVVKLFFPAGAHTWLLTEMKPDHPDILFGLCDLGMGFPELGYVSLSELESVRGAFGLGIERDIHFTARYPLSVYAEAARMHGIIVESDELLKQAAAKLAAEGDR